MKQFSKTLIFFVLTFSLLKVHACDCSIKTLATMQKLEHKQSDAILSVEVLSITKDKNLFTFKVLEVFKGNLKSGQTLVGINDLDCGPYVEVKGKWLLYTMRKVDKFELNACGLSRSFVSPERNINAVPFSPIQFPKNEKEAQSAEFKKRAKDGELRRKRVARNDLEQELRDLRKMKK